MRTHDEIAILQLNQELLKALVDADAGALDELLAPDFVAEHITGRQQSRHDWLEQVDNGRMEYHDVEEESAVLHVDGETATLTTRNRVDATVWGARNRWPLESTTTYTRTGDGWTITRSAAATY
ncbi:nuclear transport factor 2 family protein [Curtobacterium flaccumfaciens]|uniref:nuclear transport factor 2 family protein n=1 Tax=Curtobacterium flaccumfaciens TaxID=2035 RepID=UPI003423F1BE